MWPSCLLGNLASVQCPVLAPRSCVFLEDFLLRARMFSPKALLDRVSQGSGSQRSITLTSAGEDAPLFWSAPPEASLSQQVFFLAAATAPLERLAESEGDSKQTAVQCMQHASRNRNRVGFDFSLGGVKMPGICIHVTVE